MSNHIPTVTITVSEYDALRKVRESVESKEVYLIFRAWGSEQYVTNDKTHYIIELVKECQKVKDSYEHANNLYHKLRGEVINLHSEGKIKQLPDSLR